MVFCLKKLYKRSRKTFANSRLKVENLKDVFETAKRQLLLITLDTMRLNVQWGQYPFFLKS